MKFAYLHYTIIPLILFPFIFLKAQTTYTWIGSNNGSWATATNWSPSRSSTASTDILQFNDGSAKNIVNIPNQTIGKLLISNNTSIIIQSTGTRTLTIGNGNGDDLVIDSGSMLTLGGSNSLTATLNSSATASINGTLTINSGKTFNTNGTSVVTTVAGSIINSGTITNTSVSKLVFINNSIYQHSQDGNAIPTATWNANSTCLITGVTATNPTNMGQTFGNLTWNCPLQTSDANFDGIFTLNGNFTLISTGTSGIFRLASGTTNIIGNYTQSGGVNRIANTSDRILNVGGNFSMTGGELRMSIGTATGTMNIAGNFSQTAGTITETSTGIGLIVFNGTSNQNVNIVGTISGTINFTINNFFGITLLNSVTLPATLTMTQGNINTGANILSLGTSASNLGTLTRTSGTIVGNFRRWFAASTVSNVLFPIGTITNYRPANISFTSAITTSGTLTVAFTSLDPGTAGLPLNDGGTTIVNTGKEGYWSINAGDGLTGGTYSLDLTADGFNGVTNVSTLRLMKRTTGGNWILQGSNSPGTGTTSTPVVHRTGMSGFSEFGVGGSSDNPLPVELSSFSADKSNTGVILEWTTKTEVNNYGFEVQKSEGRDQESEWNTIGFVQGNGNSNSPKNYSFVDENVTSGKYFYRLKQIDTDGQFDFSKVIEVNLDSPSKFELSQNYPNPFNPNTTIRFTIPESGHVKLTIYNLLGEQVTELVNEIEEAGVHTVNFDAGNLNSGVYLYKIETGDFVQTKKMTLIK